MSSAKAWATAIRLTERLRGQWVLRHEEPALLIQRIAGNAVLCGGPVEHFSQDRPVWHPRTPEEERLRPIDILYGRYDPTIRSIDIFVNRIRQDASTFGAAVDELLEIVRIHEQAHAVVHLGTRADDVHNRLSSFGAGNKTAWSPFLAERTTWFLSLPTDLHEFLAQALTYAALCEPSAPRRSERLREVFSALEAKQPPH